MSGFYYEIEENLINEICFKKSDKTLKKYTWSLLIHSQNMEKFHTMGLFK